MIALAALLLVAASAVASAPPRFEGTRWLSPAADSAAFGSLQRAIDAIPRRLESVPGTGRDRVTARRAMAITVDSVAAALQARLESRAPVDSVALAQVLLLRWDVRQPAFGMVDSLASDLLGRGHFLLERQLGAGHPGLSPSLARMIRAYTLTQNSRRAVAFGERRLAILERMSRPDSLEIADVLEDLCSHRGTMGDFARAWDDGARALALNERRRGSEDLATANVLGRLVNVRLRQGQWAPARDLSERALRIRMARLAADDARIATALYNRGNCRYRLDEYDSARVDLERAVAIWELPKNNANGEVGAGYSLLGDILRRAGDYEGARLRLERGLEIRRRSNAPNSPTVAGAVENLAGLLEEMGDYLAALSRREESVRIRERAQGKENVEYARALDGLARLLVALDRGEVARQHAEQAVATMERALGANDAGLAPLLITLGDAQRALDDAGGSLATYRRAESLQRAAGIAESAPFTNTLRRIGVASLALHAPAAAESAFTQALALSKRRLGERHPLTIDLTDDLAHAQRDGGRPREALATALAAERAGRDQFALQAPALSERQALRYANVRPSGLPLAIGLAAQGADPDRVADVWGALVHQRAQVLDEISERRRALRRAETPAVDSLRRAHAEACQSLGGLLARAGSADPGWDQRVAAARGRLERAEAALGARSRAFREERARGGAGFAEVAASLPSGAALVAYTRVGLERWEHGRRLLDDRIVAFVLPAAGEKPFVVRVAETAVVDSLSRAWRDEMRPMARHDDPARREAVARERGLALRRAVWDPVAARLGRAKRVLVVPEGELALVNFAALPADGDSWLAESGREFHVLSSERDALSDTGGVRGSGLLAIGGVSFDSTAAPPSAAPWLATAAPALESWRGPLAACAAFRDVTFAPLPATRAEAESVAAMWPGPAADVVRLEGAAASEAEVKRLSPGRRIVHLATHGFFVDPHCGSLGAGGRGIGGLAPGADTARTSAGVAAADPARVLAAPTERQPDATENPLRLSGLALAGANLRARTPEGAEDGILTAEELAALDLGSVEWAVLSACDTGVGALEAGEGVFGLRRALRAAGVRTVLSSLWAVEDRAALSWMQNLYRRRLSEGQDTMEAVNGANRDELERRRRAGESTHPFYWAGFVAAGDWR